eukprot:12227541-Alexandrium_andersonii.AAC.1
MAARAPASRRLYPRVMCLIIVTESPMARARLSGPSYCQTNSAARPAAAPSAVRDDVPGGRQRRR